MKLDTLKLKTTASAVLLAVGTLSAHLVLARTASINVGTIQSRSLAKAADHADRVCRRSERCRPRRW